MYILYQANTEICSANTFGLHHMLLMMANLKLDAESDKLLKNKERKEYFSNFADTKNTTSTLEMYYD